MVLISNEWRFAVLINILQGTGQPPLPTTKKLPSMICDMSLISNLRHPALNLQFPNWMPRHPRDDPQEYSRIF